MLEIVGSIILAVVPVILWGNAFFRKNPESRELTSLTFFVGALSVFPILIYKFLWQFFPSINAFQLAANYQDDIIGLSNVISVPLSVIITFMFVGLIEEVVKMISVKVVDDDEIQTIDDSIEFFIIAALGFSFVENILYFYNIWITQGTGNIFLPFLFRSSFSTFAHLLFSGVLGYYYGVAHFAEPVLQEEIRHHRAKWVKVVHKLTGWKDSRLFHNQMLIEGLLLSIGLHALFNIFLEMNWTFMIVPFLIGGYITLTYLLDKKENHKNLKKLMRFYRNHPHSKSGIHFKRRAVASSKKPLLPEKASSLLKKG